VILAYELTQNHKIANELTQNRKRSTIAY